MLRRLRVRSVLDAAGRTLAFHHESDELLVALAEPVPKGMIVRLRFEIEGDMLIRPVGDNYWMLGTTAWFPQAGLGGDYYTLHSVVKVPAPFVPFAPGTTVRRVQEGTLNVLESNIDVPVRFAVLLAGNYSFSEEAREGLTVRVASYGGRNEKAMKRLTELAFSIIRFYERFLGPFPGDEFNIIEINDWGFGQGPPGTMFITREAFDPFLGDPVRHIFSRGINERFAHEIAHQYWGGSVKWASEEETWLSESFAEYSAALFVRKAMGEAEYKALLSTWKSLAKDASPASTIPLAPGIEDGGDTPFGFRVYFGLLYCKGPWLLSRIHAEIGEERFLTFLKSYQKTFRGRSGMTRDVAGLLEAVSGRDYGPFLERNFWGTGLPD